MPPSSPPDSTSPGDYVPWVPPGAPPATRMKDALRPLAWILGGAVAVALLVAWISNRGPDTADLPPGFADSEIEGGAKTSLLVDSEPVGATVWVNGDSVGITPAWLPDVAPGVVEVALRSDRGRQDTTLALRPGQDVSVLIWLDDIALAEEPRLASRDIEERLERSQAEPTDSPARREPRAPSEGDAPEPPRPARDAPSTGRLQLSTVPDGATVWVGGERVGTTPLTLSALAAGEQTVEVRTPGYEPERLRLTIAAGELATESITLRARPGIVTIAARPGTRVFVDGDLQGTVQSAPLRLPLVAGRHEIRVFHPEAGEAFRVLEVASGTSQRLTFDELDREPGWESGDAPARGTEERRRTGW